MQMVQVFRVHAECIVTTVVTMAKLLLLQFGKVRLMQLLMKQGEALLDWQLLQPACRLRGLPKLMQMVQVSMLHNAALWRPCSVHCHHG
jgi:hypothetical protein